MPANSYGPGDKYDELNSHFFPALIKKIIDAKKKNKKHIVLWGNGKAKRELVFNQDIARACVFFLNKRTKETLINIGSGRDKTITEYAKIYYEDVKFKVKIKFDKSKPNGVPQKLLDISGKKYGWKPKTSLEEGFYCIIIFKILILI